MTLSVTPTREGYGAPLRSEVLSPELALVDPELAAYARANLAEPLTTLPQSGRSLWIQVDQGGSRALTAPSGAALALDDGPAPRAPAGRSWRVLVGVAAVTVLSLLLFDVRVQVGKTPASAETPQTRAAAGSAPSRPRAASVPRPGRKTSNEGVTKPQAAAPSAPSRPRAESVPRPGRKTSTEGVTKPQARRFAWAPAPGASGYHVEFFRGSVRAFSADTTGPELTVPARWKDAGKTRRLAAGEYRWYVWPVVSGTRASSAIVRATLVVP
jgi:hypothetical protein